MCTGERSAVGCRDKRPGFLGFSLEPWTQSKKRKAIATSKFYFFDVGVTHTLAGTKSLDRNSDLYGQSFEQFIGMELRAYKSYRRLKTPLCFWRSTSQFEVDFILDESVAIETKATKRITPEHLKGLRAIQEEKKLSRYIIVSHDPIESKKGGIETMHWQKFLERLWADKIL